MSKTLPEQNSSFPDFTRQCVNYVNLKIATKLRNISANKEKIESTYRWVVLLLPGFDSSIVQTCSDHLVSCLGCMEGRIKILELFTTVKWAQPDCSVVKLENCI